MKRRILKLVLLLILGAIINVAVAWLFVKEYYATQKGATYEKLSQDDWPVLDNLGYVAAKRFDGHKQSWNNLSSDATLLQCTIYLKGSKAKLGVDAYMHVESGWPMRSLSGERISLIDSARQWKNGQVWKREFISAFAFTSTPLTARPLRLMPFGFFVNSLFYAATLWLLITGPGYISRWLRKWRGLCIDCSYDLRGSISQGCPECGKGRETEA